MSFKKPRFIEAIKNKARQMLSFEEGVDITDDTNVLYRKNIVIKNIIMLSNMAFTVVLTLMSFVSHETSNIVVTIVSFPMTYLVNRMLKKFIFDDPKSMLRQQIAMYLASFYMFLVAIFMYFKLSTSSVDFAEPTGYILLYYAIIIVALYQNKTLMKLIFQWSLVLVTLIHFTLTYSIYNEPYSQGALQFVTVFFTTPEFKDIFLRTLFLVLFMIIVYSNVQMNAYMHSQRISELTKRKTVEKDFRIVVGDLFDVVLDSGSGANDDVNTIRLVGEMSKKMCGIMGMNPNDTDTVVRYATTTMKKDELSISKSFNKVELSDDDYEILKQKTKLGNVVIKRIQLSQRAETIVRAHLEGNVNESFVMKNCLSQADLASQIILICEIYVILRTAKTYKRAYSHYNAIESMKTQFKFYVNAEVFERFMKWDSDFEEMFSKN